MVQRMQMLLIDDIDASSAEETVVFGLDGVTYEIDLSSANAEALRSDLAKWIGHGRRTGGRRNTSGGAAPRSENSREDLAKIREWARANGHKVSDRGRISTTVQDAYRKAHS